jgi:hypothetical protein
MRRKRPDLSFAIHKSTTPFICDVLHSWKQSTGIKDRTNGRRKVTSDRAGQMLEQNGSEQERMEAIPMPSGFSPFAPVQESFICVHPRHLRANLKTCHSRRTGGAFLTVAARGVKWQTRQT